MKLLWGAVCTRVGLYSKWVAMVMLGSALTGCAHNLGPADDIAAVKGIVGHSLDDESERNSIIVAVDGVYAVSSWHWSVGWGSGTAFLKNIGGKWKIIGNDPNSVSFCDLKRLGIPQEQGGPLIQFIWQQTAYEKAEEGDESWWALFTSPAPLDPKGPCHQEQH